MEEKPDARLPGRETGKWQGYWVNFLPAPYVALSSFHMLPKRVFSLSANMLRFIETVAQTS